MYSKSDSESSECSEECIICYDKVCDDFPYAIPDDDCESRKKCHPECLELWYTNYSNRGLFTDKRIHTFKIYHNNNPVETVKVIFNNDDIILDMYNNQETQETDRLLNQNGDEENLINIVPILRENTNFQTTNRTSVYSNRRCMILVGSIFVMLIGALIGGGIYWLVRFK